LKEKSVKEEIMTNKTKYPVAKLHKFLHAAPQFRPIRRGARRKAIERTYTSSDGNQYLIIRLFHELDIADQDLLLSLLAMAMTTEKSTVVGPNPKQELNIVLREKLKLDGGAVTKMNAISARTTVYEVLIELGRATGKSNYDWLEKSLDRLAGVSFKYKSKTSIENFHLLSWSAQIDENGKMRSIGFCINPYSALAILGEGGGYVLEHRGERAQLKSEEARGLHSVLCGLVDMGAERILNVDMLADRAYARYDDEISAKAIRSRRESMVSALKEIDTIDFWSCAVIGKGTQSVVKITRKKHKQAGT
jgi:hypothetical protein